MVNHVLCRSEQTTEHFLPVDFSSSPSARRQNIRSLKRAVEHLQAGGALVLFPAGGVATSRTLLGPAEELPWKPLLGMLVRRAESPVLPVYFDGQNSRLFQFASQLSQTLRLSLFLREVLQKAGDTVIMTVGALLPFYVLDAHESRRALVDRLRKETMGLASTC